MKFPRVTASLSIRIIVLFIALVAIILGSLALLSAWNIGKAIRQEYVNQGILTADFLDGALQSYGDLFDRQRLQQMLDKLVQQEAVSFHHITIFAQEDGEWVAIASTDLDLVGQPADPHHLEPLETGERHIAQHSFADANTQEIVAPIYIGNEIRATAAIYLDLTKQEKLLAAQLQLSIGVAIVGTSILVILLYITLHFLIIGPVSGLTRRSRQLAEGNFALPPPIQRKDEIGSLSQAFGEMAESLHQRELRLTALGEIGRVVNSLQQVDAIFHMLVERARDLIPFERFSIALLNEQGTAWQAAYAHGMEDVPPKAYRITQGIPGWVMRTGEAVLSPDLLKDERADTPIEKEMIVRGSRSTIVVPLHADDRIIGSLNVVGRGTDAYNSDDLSLLILLARQVETALQNARLLQRERLRAEQLHALTEINREITSILDIETLLQRVGQIIKGTFGYYRANVGIIEDEKLVFRSREDETGEQLDELEVNLGTESITGWVAQSGEPLLVNDVTQEPRYTPSPPPEKDHTLSELTVPISLGTEVLGVIDVQGSLKNTFSEEDLELLQTLAGNLAVAIVNARLLQRERQRAEQLRALAEVNREITSILETETLLNSVAQIIQETFGYHRVNVGVIQGEDLVFPARVGDPGELLSQVHLKVGKQGITAWVAQSGEPLLVNDTTQEPRYTPAPPPEIDRTLSELAVPIALGQKIIGVLDIQSTCKGAFQEEDVRLLQTLAGNLAVAMDNAHLYAESQRRLQEQAALLAISSSVSSTLQLEKVVLRVATAMVEATDTSACAISTWDPESNTLTILAEHSRYKEDEKHWGEEIGRVYQVDGYPTMAQVLQSGEAITLDANDPDADPSEIELLEEYEVQSLLMLPLKARDRVIGLVELYDEKQGRSYTEQEIAFCQAMASNAGLAFENARLYQRVQEERDAVDLLYQVGQTLSAAIDMEQVLPRVLSQAVETTGAYRGSILVLDLLGNPRHHILVREDLSPSVIRRMVLEILRRGLAGWVVQNRRPALLKDTDGDPRWLELPDTLKGIRSALAVPLMRGTVLVGVLTLVHHTPGYFTEKHQELITSVANQAAIAIDNARLLVDTQRRVAQLNALLEINQSLTSDLPIQELLELVTFSAHGLLDASNTVLYLLDKEEQMLTPQFALGADSLTLREMPIQVGEGLTGLVVQKRRSHTLNEAHLSSISKRLVNREAEPEALLAVPLLQGNVAVGALTVGRYGEGVQFGSADQEIAELLGSQVVVALNNARLYDQTRRRADEMASLNLIARTVGSTLDLQRVLGQVIDELKRSFRVEAGSIFLKDQERNELYFATTLEGGMERFQDVRLPVGVGIAGYVAQTGDPTMVNDMANDPRFYSKISKDVGFVNRSTLCVPLRSRDRIIGVVQLLNKTEGDFDQNDMNRLQSIAATVAVAIENAGLYEQTEEERGRLNAILTSTADAIVATDAQQRLLLINPAATRDFGLNTDQHIGQPLSEVLEHQGLRDLFFRAVQNDQPLTGEITLQGDVTLYVNISPVRGVTEQTLGHVAVMQDITTLKELDKMKSEFVATVSHDLKTPLTAIRGFADLIKMTSTLEPQQTQFLDRIREITGEMATMINDLLDIGKIEAGIEMEQVPCDIVAMAQDTVESLSPQAQENQIEVSLEIPEQVPEVIGDPERIKQVLMNLIGNAIKYTPQGGHVLISLQQEDSQLVTRVRDDGIGVSPRDQKQLFQKFYRVRSDKTAHIEGTGLGLTIARSIVERHGGRIWIESEIGQGSTFAFSLPLLESEQQA